METLWVGMYAYTSGNGTFSYFVKGVLKTVAYLELEAYSEP